MNTLLALLLTAAAAAPGWLGIGYIYHVSGHGGWMRVQELDPTGPQGRS